MMSENSMFLSCGNHKIEGGVGVCVKYPVVELPEGRTHAYELMTDLHTRYMVKRRCVDDRYILIHKEFGKTVEELLDGKTFVHLFDRYYFGKSKIDRPRHPTMELVHGMLQEQFKFLDNNYCGGDLGNLKSYGVVIVPESERDLGRESIEAVWLGSIKKDVLNKEEAIIHDGMVLCNLFGELLGVKEGNWPKYLEDWASLFRPINWLEKNRWLIQNSPCWWPWRKRRVYVEEVWQRHEMGDAGTKRKILNAMKKVRGVDKWKGVVVDRFPNPNNPLRIILKARVYDPKRPMEMLRFMRYSNRHMNDKIRENGALVKRFIKEPKYKVYEDARYVEMVLSDVFPTFLVDLVRELHEEGITIRYF